MTKKDNDKTPKKYKLRKNDKKKNYKVTENSDSDEDDSDWTPGDDDAMDAFKTLSCEEGILPALETSHGLAYALQRAKELSPSHTICVNLSGRGDKDAMEAARIMGVKGLPKMTFA